ncbi:HNH endonuclease [Gluconobacter oxydans]|uniref:HNH endonuclease n=1 Tax=Gluconobacter oxydans TaxID=442 RepID=UPI000780FA3E|nr:HNH endonuclease [Gluconobacter oxydans]MCP1247409.1 HNH endonuclease [Gluconobacter oxydans]
MLTKDAIKRRLIEMGFKPEAENLQKAEGYDLGRCHFYILKVKSDYKFAAVDRPTRDHLANLKLPGVVLGSRRASTGFRRFKEKTPHDSNIGFFVNFDTLSAFDRFLAVVTDEREDALSSDLEAIARSPDLTATQKKTLINARVGQGAFRASLIRLWDGKCAVTGVAVQELLRASHVKPWASSTNEERLDIHNGLLLVANLDAAFDKHLISFTDNGEMLLSDALGADGRAVLGVSSDARLLKPLTPQQKAYLTEHRSRLR